MSCCVSKDRNLLTLTTIIPSSLLIAGQANYAASKAGVLGLTKTLGRELSRNDIRVNAICPCFIESPMTDGLPDNIKEIMKRKIVMKRFGIPQNIADCVLFLASERSSYITGEAIEVSGSISI